jgi:hypothetical protein
MRLHLFVWVVVVLAALGVVAGCQNTQTTAKRPAKISWEGPRTLVNVSEPIDEFAQDGTRIA